MKNISRWIACMLATMFLAGVFAPLATAGSDQDAKDKKDMRRLQLQLAAAQQEKVVLSAQVDELKKQLSEFKSKSTVLEKKTGAERKQISELAEKFQEAEKKIQDLTLLNTETSKTLLQTQTEKDREKNVLEGGVQVCEKKNAALYQISVDLMAKYRSKGIVSSLLQAEPFTQLEKVKIENLLQEYRDKADAAKIASNGSNVQADHQP